MQSPPFPRYLFSPIPNILLNTMFSNTLNFVSSRNVSDQASHPYKTTGKEKNTAALISPTAQLLHGTGFYLNKKI